MDHTNNAYKLRAARELLQISSTIFVHVDSRTGGLLDLPLPLMQRPQIVLQVGPDMTVPIPDLSFDGNGMRATLSFGRQMHTCVVPWRAVKAIVTEVGTGAVFDEEWRQEVEVRPAPFKGRGHLRLVKG